jgi:hypothetical protein
METKQDVKHDADRSSEEKVSEGNIEAPHPYVADLPPDPDAHLSAQERAAIVSFPKCATKCHILGSEPYNIF